MSAETSPVPRVALNLDEAALALGMSRDSLERHVLPDLRVIRRGRLRLVAIAELQRWVNEHGEHTLNPRGT